MQTDFPEPVVPAIKRCGIFDKSKVAISPEVVLPTARANFDSAEANFSELIMDLSPTKVIISEWVKLADKHSSSQSAKFVNGILDKLSQEI